LFPLIDADKRRFFGTTPCRSNKEIVIFQRPAKRLSRLGCLFAEAIVLRGLIGTRSLDAANELGQRVGGRQVVLAVSLPRSERETGK